jgi:hypothetical protein
MINNLLTNKTAFIDTIYRLRNNEEIVVFEKQFAISEVEDKEVGFFLEAEFDNESADYPFTAPPFHQPAALWAAKIIYFGAQLLLFREETAKDISVLFPEYNNQKTAAEHLSADICLRFLPYLVNKLKEIDPEDALIKRMETIMMEFPYSAVGYFTESGVPQFDNSFMENICCSQLLINRVITKKDKNTAAEPAIKLLIQSAMGAHLYFFWPNLDL